jgi:hypothetical protein
MKITLIAKSLVLLMLLLVTVTKSQEKWEETDDPNHEIEQELKWEETDILANDSLLVAAKCPKAGDGPQGAFAVIPWDKKPKPKTWKSDNVSGVVIRMYWKDIDTGATSLKYDWKKLDVVFAKAECFSKKVHLMIAPGFYSPDRVLNDASVKKANFIVPQGPYKGEMRPLPLPWDKNYLDHWFVFVDTLAKRYGPREELVLISVTGPNSHNGEVNLPRKKSDKNIIKGGHPNYDPIKKWIKIVSGPKAPGGSDDEQELKEIMLKAYGATLDTFHAKFVVKFQKHLSLQIFDQSFPVNNKQNEAIQNGFQEDLIANAIAKGCFKNHNFFVLMNGGLRGMPVYPLIAKPPSQWKRIQQLSGKIVTGFQTKAPGNLYDGIEHDSQLSRLILAQTIINGITHGASFIEFYERDVLAENHQDLIEEANIMLIK